VYKVEERSVASPERRTTASPDRDLEEEGWVYAPDASGYHTRSTDMQHDKRVLAVPKKRDVVKDGEKRETAAPERRTSVAPERRTSMEPERRTSANPERDLEDGNCVNADLSFCN
jgi:hypothetical protein